MCLGGGTPREACSLTPSPLSRAFREVTKWGHLPSQHTQTKSILAPEEQVIQKLSRKGLKRSRTKPHICAEEGIEAQRGEATCPESHSP